MFQPPSPLGAGGTVASVVAGGLLSMPKVSEADAVLVIGDRAIHSPPGQFSEVWDLGDEWCRWTDLPLVFAMWTARRGDDLGGIAAALAEARDRGVAHLDQIAAAEAPKLGLTRPVARVSSRRS